MAPLVVQIVVADVVAVVVAVVVAAAAAVVVQYIMNQHASESCQRNLKLVPPVCLMCLACSLELLYCASNIET